MSRKQCRKLNRIFDQTHRRLDEQMREAFYPDGRQAAVERLNVMAGYTPEGFIAPPPEGFAVQPCTFWRNRTRAE